MIVTTTSGKTYCVTTVGPCTIQYTFDDKQVITLLAVTEPGQYYFVAPGGEVETSNASASCVECFNAAPAGVSSGGGGALPKPGLAYVSGIPSVLTGDTVHDVGVCPAALDLSALAFVWGGRVETCELWLTLDAINASVITFPGSWTWVNGAPSFDTLGKAYRIAIRREPDQVVANLAYSA